MILNHLKINLVAQNKYKIRLGSFNKIRQVKMTNKMAAFNVFQLDCRTGAKFDYFF